MKQLIKLARFSSTDGVKSLGNVSAILAGIFLHTVDDVKSCENILYQLTCANFFGGHQTVACTLPPFYPRKQDH